MSNKWWVHACCVLTACVALLGCAGGDAGNTPDAGADACTRLACPRACTTPADCAAGQECNGGLCTNPAATVSAYKLCALDADCPQGDHCDTGVCAHQCVADRDCAAGTVCDARGRCQAPETAGASPAAVAPRADDPVLTVNAAPLEFLSFTEARTLSVRNTGQQVLRFRVLADRPFVQVTPASGSVLPGQALPLEVRLATGAHAGEASAGLTLLSNGGSASLTVIVPRRLEGTYRGAFSISSPVALGTLPLSLSLSEAADGQVTGVVDADRSPAYGFRATVTGMRTADGKYALTFTVPARTGSRANPAFKLNLRRTVTLQLGFSGADGLVGALSEQFEGKHGFDVALQGAVQLNRTGPRLPVSPEVAPALTLDEVVEPTWSLTCTTCPGNVPCPEDDLEAGRLFLQAAFPVYERFRTEGYAAISECATASGACYSSPDLQCAQMRLHRALSAGPQACTNPAGQTVPDCATRGMLDTLKGLLHWRAFQSNEMLTGAYRWGDALDVQKAKLESARAALLTGIVPEIALTPQVRPLGEPYFVRWLATLPPEVLAGNRHALTPEQSGVGTRSPVYALASPQADLVRPLEALATFARTSSAVARAQQRLEWGTGNTAGSAALAQRATASAYVLGALFGTALAKQGGAALMPAAFPTEVSLLAQRADQIAAGLNPAGVSDQAVPYVYKQNGRGTSNFEQALNFVQGELLTTAERDEQNAKNAVRSFEADQHQLSQELGLEATRFEEQLFQLCGEAHTSGKCGLSSGTVHDLLKEIEQAHLRVAQAHQAVVRVYQEVDIEKNRAAEVTKIHDNRIRIIYADGRQLDELAEREQSLNRVQAWVGLAGSFLGAFAAPLTGGFKLDPPTVSGSGIAGVASGITSLLQAGEREEIERARRELQLRQQAAVVFDQKSIELKNSEARIKSLLLEVPSLHINIAMAVLDIQRLTARLQHELRTAANLAQERNRLLALRATDPRVDPLFRVERDALVLLAQRSFEALQRWTYFVTRAYEYDVNVSYGPRSQLFTLNTVDGLKRFLGQLAQDYMLNVRSPQARTTTFSLRRDVLGLRAPVRDPVTGVEYSPVELFRRYVADPRHRDAKGNLRLEFELSVAEGNPIFSTTVCNDRISGLKVSLVGAQLGVTQPQVELVQRGTGFLRSCSRREDGSGAPALETYDIDSTLGVQRALIQAGVNLSGPNDPSVPTDGQLHGRPVAAQYVLRIDQRTEPANAALDLSKLDDIEFYLSHESNSVQ